MSLLEAQTLDMSALLMQAYDLGDTINRSVEMADFQYWKEQLAADDAAQQLIRHFSKKKEQFEECERFGHFHPDYHKALDDVKEAQRQMEANEAIRRFRLAEDRLDDLLFQISKLIAGSVSESIKVPSNQLQDGGGCSSGGCSGGKCSGGCG